jgi:hypothetical protein
VNRADLKSRPPEGLELVAQRLQAALWPQPAAAPVTVAPTADPQGVALGEPPASAAVARQDAAAALDALRLQLAALGLTPLAPASVAAILKARNRALPLPSAEPASLASLARDAGAGFAATVIFEPRAVDLKVRLLVVDAVDAKVIWDNSSSAAYAKAKLLVEAVRKQAPQAASAMTRRIAEREALAARPTATPPSDAPRREPDIRPVAAAASGSEPAVAGLATRAGAAPSRAPAGIVTGAAVAVAAAAVTCLVLGLGRRDAIGIHDVNGERVANVTKAQADVLSRQSNTYYVASGASAAVAVTLGAVAAWLFVR